MGAAQKILANVKFSCCWSRRDKIMAKGLSIIEREMDVDRIIKRQAAHSSALKALLNPNQRQLIG
jgi:hypothetical protein